MSREVFEYLPLRNTSLFGMCEQHLDFLSPETALHVLRSRRVRTGHVAGVFVQIPRDPAGKSVFGQHCGLSLQVSIGLIAPQDA
jgi:hypothetical protein